MFGILQVQRWLDMHEEYLLDPRTKQPSSIRTNNTNITQFASPPINIKSKQIYVTKVVPFVQPPYRISPVNPNAKSH